MSNATEAAKDQVCRVEAVVVEAFRKHKGNDEYSDYIRNVLAFDFACTLADMLEGGAAAISTPYNVEQAKAWIKICRVLNEVAPNWREWSEFESGAQMSDRAAFAVRKLGTPPRVGWQFRYMEEGDGSEWTTWANCPARIVEQYRGQFGFQFRPVYAGEVVQ